MATSRDFNAMLNEHLNYGLLKEEIVKRDYILQKVEKDDTWKGGKLIVPFKGAQASSIAFGELTDAADIGSSEFVRGEISTQPEIWGSMKFNSRDIMEHDGKVNEASFLKILPDEIEDFASFFKQNISLSITNGAHICSLTANATANDGNITVDRPERLNLGMKFIVDDGNSDPLTGYVKAINMNTGVVNLVTARGGSTALDFSAADADMTTAQGAKVYLPGAQSAGMTSLKSSLLPATAGGSSTLYGKTKVTYPYLQAIAANVAGALTTSNILGTLFDHFTLTRNRGKGRPDTVLVSYTHLGTIMKAVEASKGAYSQVNETKVNLYGWTEVTIQGVKGVLTIVGVQEMDNDWIPFIDFRALKFHSNGFIKRQKSPDGNEYFTVRATTGYSFIIDMCVFGDLVLSRPSYCGVLYGIT